MTPPLAADAATGLPVDATATAATAAREPCTLKQEIIALMRDFSIEKTPAEVASLRALPVELTAGSRVYITWIAGNEFTRTLRACARLRELGMQPVPHLAAREIADVGALDTLLAALQREAAVEHTLLVAGSMRAPLGRFDSSLPALASGLFERHGGRALGLAAHPEGSADIKPAALADALRAKNAHARTSPLHMHLVTQFCFDAAPLIDWERRTRAAGNRLPVHVGLAGLASLPTLLKYARSCGVGASLSVLTRHAGRLFKLVSAVTPGEIVVALAAARMNDAQCLVERLHFFPFGSFDATVAWAAAVARGEFHLSRDQRDIVV